MEPEMKKQIEETVIEILKNGNMDEMTESRVRQLASEELGLDLSLPGPKLIVKHAVQSFLKDKMPEAKEEEEEEEVDKEQTMSVGGKEYDDDGDLIICRLSDRRKVTIQDFRGKTLVSLREYYKRDGKELPTSKGISLTSEQWSSFKKNVPAIEKAIRKMESRLN